MDFPYAIEADSLSFSYGKRVALNGMSFKVGVGELFALVGPNGGGKTTTFHLLSTLYRPQSGTLRIFGFDAVREPEEVRRRLGVVFQAPALDKKLTVRENLIHQGHLYGKRGGMLRERIGQLLEKVGLSDRAGERIEKLSGGLKRRVEIARGLLVRPPLLLLDEPTTGLDPDARNEVWELLERLKKEESITVVYTTHLMEEAAKAQRVLRVEAGKGIAHA